VSDGVVFDSDTLSVVDFDARRWEANPGIPGARMKALASHEDGWIEVLLNWLPPDLGGGPHRHRHRSVRERGLVIEGELPMAEFVAGEAGPGVAVLFRAGFYMDRAPGCLHGLDPSRRSRSGFTILEWRDGPGTYLMEDHAADESIVEDAPREARALEPDPRPGVVIERDDLTLLDVFALPWADSKLEPGVRVQILTPGEVAIAYAPPDTQLEAAGSRRGYVLAGSVALAAGVTAGPGSFVQYRQGEPPLGVAGEVGARILRF